MSKITVPNETSQAAEQAARFTRPHFTSDMPATLGPYIDPNATGNGNQPAYPQQATAAKAPAGPFKNLRGGR